MIQGVKIHPSHRGQFSPGGDNLQPIHTDAVSIFPTRGAITRLVGAVLAEQTDEWLEGRRYLGLDVLRRSQLHLVTTTQEIITPDHTTPARLNHQTPRTRPLHHYPGLGPLDRHVAAQGVQVVVIKCREIPPLPPRAYLWLIPRRAPHQRNAAGQAPPEGVQVSSDYESLTQFVREVLIEPGLTYNTLDTTTSAIRSITSAFEERGWTVVPVVVEGSKQPRHEVTSPDGTITLNMNGAKVFRHPYHTEKICQRKHLTKRMLEFDKIATAAGADFDRKDADIALAYFSKIPKPIVVKPTNSGGSHGVTVGVTDEAGFSKAWAFAIEEGGPQSNILIEQFVRGVELRALVVGDCVDSIIARIQPFVVGEGTSTMTSLIEGAHDARKVHYRSTQLPIAVRWDFIERQGHGAETVPADGEVVYLGPLALPADGALLVDVSDFVSPDVKQLAIDARRAIPGLEVGGVDILISDLRDASTAVVLEVNTAPSLNLHRYATHGAPREVQLDVVDYFHDQYLAGEARPA